MQKHSISNHVSPSIWRRLKEVGFVTEVDDAVLFLHTVDEVSLGYKPKTYIKITS